MPLMYTDVLVMWQGLHFLHGMSGMYEKSSFGHECVREFLMRFRSLPVIAQDQNDMAVIMEMILLLTVLSNMTFKAAMDGDDRISQLSTWIADAHDIVGPPETWAHLQSVIVADPEHFRLMLSKAQDEMNHLKAECNPGLPYVHNLLGQAELVLVKIKTAIHPLL